VEEKETRALEIEKAVKDRSIVRSVPRNIPTNPIEILGKTPLMKSQKRRKKKKKELDENGKKQQNVPESWRN